jgi:hypothetical protein
MPEKETALSILRGAGLEPDCSGTEVNLSPG